MRMGLFPPTGREYIATSIKDLVGYKNLLTDLGLHHPPCQRYKLNAAFFPIATLAHTLGAALDVLGGGGEPRGPTLRQDGQERKRPTPWRTCGWRLRGG